MQQAVVALVQADCAHISVGLHSGMEVRVREATLSTNEEGLATDVFKLTTLQGTALPDARAKEVVERVCSHLCSVVYPFVLLMQ